MGTSCEVISPEDSYKLHRNIVSDSDDNLQMFKYGMDKLTLWKSNKGPKLTVCYSRSWNLKVFLKFLVSLRLICQDISRFKYSPNVA